MRKIVLLLTLIQILSLDLATFAKDTEVVKKGSVRIINYPTSVTPGISADVEVVWDNIPIDKGYILRIQLENWDVDPGICIVKDITEFPARSKESSVISLSIPSNTGASTGLRFVAAFISKTKEWNDTLCMTATKKDVTMVGLLEILDYPKLVHIGESAQIKIKWEGLPKDLDKNYKLLVQLENWDVEPGIAIAQEIDSFSSVGGSIVSLDIPVELSPASGCSFVVAFLSRTRGWDDVFYIVRTSKDVEIR